MLRKLCNILLVYLHVHTGTTSDSGPAVLVFEGRQAEQLSNELLLKNEWEKTRTNI